MARHYEGDLINAVDALMGTDKVPEAYALCAKAAGFYPGSASVRIRMAEIAHALGQRDEALALVREAVALDPLSANLLTRAADTLELLREYEAAAEYLRRALKLEPGAAEAALKLARLSLWSGRYREAADLAGAILKQDGSQQAAYRIRGATGLLLGRRKEAARDLAVALKLEPKDTESYIWMGELHRRLGQIAKAKVFFNKARKICPYPPLGAVLNLALITLAEGRKLSDLDLSTISSWVPEDIVDVRAERPALAPARLTRLFAKALDRMKGNRSLKPTFLWGNKLVEYIHYYPRNYLVQIQSTVRFGDYRRVLGAFDKLIASTPEESYLYSHRGEVRLWTGRYAEALEDFQKARALNDKLLWPKVGIGASYLLLEDYPNALKHIEAAAELASESIISTWRGELYRRLGDHKRALRELGKIKEHLPFRPAVWLNTALSKAALGDADGAADILFALRKHAPDFIADAARAAGVQNAPDRNRWTRDAVLKTVQAAFALMRGNRSSWMYCYILDDTLKVIRLRDMSTKAIPANFYGFTWGFYPDFKIPAPTWR